MNSWHALSKYYKKLDSLDDKIQFAILGNEFLQTKYDYANIVERFNRYKGWLNSNSVLSLKYEDLIGPQKKIYIENILKFYNERSDSSIEIESYSDKIIKNLDPSKSHTFREGGSNKWKKYFTDKNKTTFKEVAGNLLVDLQYEKDLNW